MDIFLVMKHICDQGIISVNGALICTMSNLLYTVVHIEVLSKINEQ